MRPRIQDSRSAELKPICTLCGFSLDIFLHFILHTTLRFQGSLSQENVGDNVNVSMIASASSPAKAPTPVRASSCKYLRAVGRLTLHSSWHSREVIESARCNL